MANPKHIEVLKLGVTAWNGWRQDNSLTEPDLSFADLRLAKLSGANFHKTNLTLAHLNGADLNGTNFAAATLTGANFSGANLRRAVFILARLRFVSFLRANLREADLREADLGLAHFGFTDLGGVKLQDADLRGADFIRVELGGADISGASLGATTFCDTNLSVVNGLQFVRHLAPSMIDVQTILMSGGKIPTTFLRGFGLPEALLTQIPTLIASVEPIQFYSCFISYSSKDQDFADRLHADLQSKGVRVWFAPHDMPIGARLRSTIDESIRVYDKLLLVLSEQSVSSQWVEQEVETALRKERQSGGTVLFPVRLDDTVLEIDEGWPALVKDTRNIGDFCKWKEHDSYQKAFDRLLRDLIAEA